jgi:hypothetical protein
METLSVDNGERTKEPLSEELKRYGVPLKEDEILKASEHELERMLQDVKSKQQDTSTVSQNSFVDLYESMICDYINKLTVATVFFFSCNPWAALFWPPYYYYNKKRSENEYTSR